jgi:multicomponent Na+:H+ antiporter subunit C
MFIVMALLVGALYAAAFYLLLARSTVKLIFGSAACSATRRTCSSSRRVASCGPSRRSCHSGAAVPLPGYADPIPQALILTAIVISFAVLAFAAVLVKRAYIESGTDDSEEMRTSEQ